MKSAAAIFVGLGLAAGAGAQTYPEKQVLMVVPFPAGGAVDPVARVLASRMSELWKQPVVVLNRAGAGGNIGSESVARAAPDGHTLLFGSTALAIGPSLYAKLGFDVLKDLIPVSQVITAPNLLVTHPSLPVHSVQQLVALARSRPGELISASAGVGSSLEPPFLPALHEPLRDQYPPCAVQGRGTGGGRHPRRTYAYDIRADSCVDRTGAVRAAARDCGHIGEARHRVAGYPDDRGHPAGL